MQQERKTYTVNEYAKRDDDRIRHIDQIKWVLVIVLILLLIVRFTLW